MLLWAGSIVAALDLWERRLLAGLDGSLDGDEADADEPLVSVHAIATPDGGRLHIEDRGSGRPVVLLHGHGAALGTFAKLAPRLVAAGHRVVAIDQRGFGLSSAIPDAFDFLGVLDDTAAVLEALDLRDAIIVGHSTGGMVALGLALHHPEVVNQRVRGLVLLNSTARLPADDRRNRALVAAMDWPVLERLSRHPRHGVVLTRGNFGVGPHRQDVEAARLIGLESPVASRRGFSRRLLGTDLTAELPNVQVPVLAIGGSADRIVAARESMRLGRLLPNARVHIFDGAGHMLPMERAAAVSDLIVDFAIRLDQGRGDPESPERPALRA